jgi:large subunit ribosomal protein L6
MSRIGKKPITVPANVKVNLDPARRTITIDGPKGKLSYQWRPEVAIAWNEDEKQIVCSIPEEQMTNRAMRAFWGTDRARIQNMITGSLEGYSKKLEIIGVGWNAQQQGNTLRLNIGYCHPVDLTPPASVEFKVEGPVVTISGPDKQSVGQFAAVVRSKRPPEPYNGKGIKYSDEIITRKQGKVFGA